MNIVFTKISNEEHSVQDCRADNSVEETKLNSRNFLRHDLAHLAIETEVPLRSGYWGLVAGGSSLSGSEMKGKELGVAESLAGRVQTLMRVEASVEQYENALKEAQPYLASEDLAQRIYERTRQFQGHWKATGYGDSMHIEWPENN